MLLPTNRFLFLFIFFAAGIGAISKVSAQSASSVVNNAAPTASVSTNANGGTQINQQLNNVFDTSFGFGPGIICKTPQIVINGNTGFTNSNLSAFPLITGNNQNAANFGGSISLAIPIASSVISDCQRYVAQIAQDRILSSELSLIRACAQLEKEKITIDPEKYPNLAKCITNSTAQKALKPQASR